MRLLLNHLSLRAIISVTPGSKSKTLVHGSFNQFLPILSVSIIQKSAAVGRQTASILLVKSSFIKSHYNSLRGLCLKHNGYWVTEVRGRGGQDTTRKIELVPSRALKIIHQNTSLPGWGRRRGPLLSTGRTFSVWKNFQVYCPFIFKHFLWGRVQFYNCFKNFVPQLLIRICIILLL